MRLLGGKPLLSWAIDAAKTSKVTPYIIVSTEDDNIAKHAESEGVEVLIRPPKLSVDPAGVVDVALHALDSLTASGRTFKTLIILLPTCPFRTSEDISAALELFISKRAKFLMSVSPYSHTPFAALSMAPKNIVSPLFSGYFGKKSQELPTAYRPNGAIHILNVVAFQKEKSYCAQPLFAYVMPSSRSVDIDTEEDLLYAEFLLGKKLSSNYQATCKTEVDNAI